MKKRYLHLRMKHGAIAIISGLLVLLCVTAGIVNALADRPPAAIALFCGAATFAFLTWCESSEAIRCHQIARRWDHWDRRDLPPTHLQQP